jgi:TonB family protein
LVSALDPSLRIPNLSEAIPERPARAAIGAAVLLHAAVMLWLFAGWKETPAPQPPVIEATLVEEPPPPAPAPAPAPPRVKPEPPPSMAARSSGPDQETKAPPHAIEPAPKPTPPPPETSAPAPAPPTEAPPPDETAAAPAVVTAPPPKPPSGEPRRTAAAAENEPHPPAHAEPRKDQLASRGPVAPDDNRAIGEREETGDPYLNLMYARIERQRAPTTPIGPSGLHLEGIAVWEILLDRNGSIEATQLVRSSGSELLDAEARRMILAASPFPPMPSDFPDKAAIRVTIRLFPR